MTKPLLLETAAPTGPAMPAEIPQENRRSRDKRDQQARNPAPWHDLGEGAAPMPRGPPEVWKLQEVQRVTGLSRTQVYRLVKHGLFPKPVKTIEGGRGVGWLSTEVGSYIRSRILARDQGDAA